jgi:hypothetical protein
MFPNPGPSAKLAAAVSSIPRTRKSGRRGVSGGFGPHATTLIVVSDCQPACVIYNAGGLAGAVAC